MPINVYTPDGRCIRARVNTLEPVWFEGREYRFAGSGHSVGAQPVVWSYTAA